MQHLFGTDGMRARIGTDFLTHETLPILAHALGWWIRTDVHPDVGSPEIVILHDTRQSCAYIKAHLKTSLLVQGISVADAQILPTPALCAIMKATGHKVGIVISASHNPWRDNVIKIMRDHEKLSAQDEHLIEKKYYELLGTPARHLIDYESLGSDTLLPGSDIYHTTITRTINKPLLHGLTVVIDTACGATSTVAPLIFSACGINVITINNTPTGTNINDQAGALYPQKLQDAVLHYGADAGFAFDGDGDRVVAVAGNGVLKNGDDLLALLSQHPAYAHETTVVGTTMSNGGFEEWLRTQGKSLLRTPVGDKYVAQALAQEGLSLGGEQSGHIIMNNYLSTGDGIYVALKILETMRYTHNMMMSTFTAWPQVLTTITVNRQEDLQQEPFVTMIDDAQKMVPAARVSVRYSGTEKNALRIMVESKTQESSQRLAALLAGKLERELA